MLVATNAARWSQPTEPLLRHPPPRYDLTNPCFQAHAAAAARVFRSSFW